MKEQAGLFAVAGAILLSTLIFAVTHRYQYFPQAHTATDHYAHVFDTWTGKTQTDLSD